MVELSETASILKEATPASLVILDELGRGTSTADGFAIAYAVLNYLLSIQCLGLFSTHYSALTKEYATNPLVKCMFMSFMAHRNQRTVSFLYKLTTGVCTNSYGMNVAAVAGIPEHIIQFAEQVAAQLNKH